MTEPALKLERATTLAEGMYPDAEIRTHHTRRGQILTATEGNVVRLLRYNNLDSGNGTNPSEIMKLRG